MKRKLFVALKIFYVSVLRNYKLSVGKDMQCNSVDVPSS